jgi:hypothetical protein
LTELGHLRQVLIGLPVLVVLDLVILLWLLFLALAGRRRAALLAIPVALSWSLVNNPLEGPVLISFTREHGLTVSDLLSFLVVPLAIRAWRRGVKSRPGPLVGHTKAGSVPDLGQDQAGKPVG